MMMTDDDRAEAAYAHAQAEAAYAAMIAEQKFHHDGDGCDMDEPHTRYHHDTDDTPAGRYCGHPECRADDLNDDAKVGL